MAERAPDFRLRQALPKEGRMLHTDRRVWGYQAKDKLLSLETGEIVQIIDVKPGLKDILVWRGQDGTEPFWQPAGTGWVLA